MSAGYYAKVDAVRFARVGNAAKWGEKEDHRLRVLYPAGSWDDIRSALPHRTKRAIEQRAIRLGIERQAGRKPAWTGAEEKRLREMFGVASWSEIAEAVPRHTTSAVKNKAAVLGLRRPPRARLQSRYQIVRALRAARREQRVFIKDLAEIIGVPSTSVQRWELGLNVPRLPMLFDWAQALGFEITLTLKGRDA